MADIRHYFEDKQINEPRNWKSAKVTANFLDKKEVAVDVTTLNFAGENAVEIISRAKESIFEGSEYKIIFGNVNSPAYVFNGNLDYADEFKEIGCNECLVKIKKKQGTDWIEERADSFGFPFLYQIGVIKDSDFVEVPYVINYIPDNMQLLTLSISVFMLTKETIETIKSISATTKDLIAALIPSTPSPAPAWTLGQIVGVALKGAIETLYAVALSIAIANMLKDIIEQLLPKKRNHLGMNLLTLMEKGCEHLGLEFKSEQIEKYGEIIPIPSKGFKGGSPEPYDLERGFPANGTFGDFFRKWLRTLNSDYSIENGVLRFERWDYWKKTSSFLLSDVYNDQEKLVNVIGYNTDEVKSNYIIEFVTDSQDQNTIDNQDRRIYQNTISIIAEKDKKLTNLKGAERLIISESLAVRKNELTRVEKALKGLLQIGDAITGRSDATKILSRLGTMHLSSHFITEGKIVIMDGSELKKNQRDHFNANLLWDNEHYINSFVPIDGVHNQFEIIEGLTIPFCEEDFKKIEDNQFFTDNFGNFGKIDSLEWFPYENKATLNYRINKLYATNLKLNTV